MRRASPPSQCRRACAPPVSAAAAKIQNDLRILTERLARINDNLARKISSRNEYDKTIQETEAAYQKVGRCRTEPGLASPPIQPVTHGTAAANKRCVSRTDHGELTNAAARAQARERQPHEEEADVQLVAPQYMLSQRGAARGL